MDKNKYINNILSEGHRDIKTDRSAYEHTIKITVPNLQDIYIKHCIKSQDYCSGLPATPTIMGFFPPTATREMVEAVQEPQGKTKEFVSPAHEAAEQGLSSICKCICFNYLQ